MTGWIEAQPHFSVHLPLIYMACDDIGVESIHHFWHEPWHPDGPAVRIKTDDERITQWLDRFHINWGPWNPFLDEQLYGERWDDVARFFEAASRLALTNPDAKLQRKLVHCALNSWCLTVKDEYRFARRFAAGRRRMLIHDAVYDHLLRKRTCHYGCHPVTA